MSTTKSGGIAEDADHEERVVAWLESNVGGKVVTVRRQPRWRPVWFVDLEVDGAVRSVCVRGARHDSELLMPLDHENRFQRLLQEHGIPVVPVLGWCDDPPASVMETVPGLNEWEPVSDDVRATIVDEYVQVLARIHALPLEPFVEAGIIRASRAGDSWRVGIDRIEAVYRRAKVRPDPLMEFVLGWLWRNPLKNCERETPIVWDSGQYHHVDGHLTHIMDLELAHLGDPMMDLAGWRMRGHLLGVGDFRKLYARYEELSGTPIDWPAIKWHHVAFTLSVRPACHKALAEPSVEGDFMTYSGWTSNCNLYAIEALAEILGVDLEPVEIPVAVESSASVAREHLVQLLETIDVDDEFASFQLGAATELARHVQRDGEIGRAVEDADLDDLHRLLGRRPESWAEGEAELERFVLGDEGAHDEELLVLFHRRSARYKALMGAPDTTWQTIHHPIQKFGDEGNQRPYSPTNQRG